MDEKYEFFIAGVQHHNSGSCIDQMSVGDELNLVQEPDNKYDPNAVRIVFLSDEGDLSVMLGYVPAKISPSVSADLTIQPMRCEITELNLDKKPWERIKVLVETKT